MKHRLIALGLLASVMGLANAQSTRQIYLVKGNKVVATLPASDVEYISFSAPQGVYLPITPKQGDNTTLTMYNCSDDWEKDPADRKFDCFAGKLVKFMWYADYGFVGTLKVTGASGTKVDYEYVTDDEEFGTCWECYMPEEPITIETIATEKTDYVGRSFVGTYKGYPISVGTNGVFSSSEPSLSLRLSSNTSFHASVDGGKEFAGCYSFDGSRNTFSYLDEYSADVYGKKTYGVAGTWFDGGDALVVVNDLNDDKPDNNRYFFASTSDCTFTSAASDSYGSRYLFALNRNGSTSYYYYDRLSSSIEPVTLSFSSGTSIDGASSALVSDALGTTLFRYSRASESANPVFTMKGKEAGTYTSTTGTGDALTLDGFGSATYGSVKGSYTYKDGIVTLTTADGEFTFTVDTATQQYTATKSGEWDGSEDFAASVTGRYDSNTASMGMIAISLNHDYAGNEEKGTVKFQATLTTDFYETKEIISNTASYTYDDSKKQLTISGLLVGTANGRSTERINITFDVNADKTQLTCNEAKVLRAVSGGDTRYIELNGVTLMAR